MIRVLIISAFMAALAGCASPKPVEIVSNHPLNVYISGGTVAERNLAAAKVCNDIFPGLVPKINSEANPYSIYKCVYSKQDVSGIRLKVIQTRAFEKRVQEVQRAARVQALDQGGGCGFLITETNVGTVSRPVEVLDVPRSTMECSVAKGGLLRLKLRYEFEKREPELTWLRIRAYVEFPDGGQITEQSYYSTAHRQIANQLFIEAIEITPMEAR